MSKDDGLIQRFLLCCPKPKFYKAEEIINATEPICSLDLIFFYIKLLNDIPRRYKLSKEADVKFNEYFTKFRLVVQKNHDSDTFLR